MNNIIKYIVVVILLMLSNYFVNNLIQENSSNMSEYLLSLLIFIKGVMVKPLFLFEIFFATDYIKENVFIFNFIMALIIALPITALISTKKENDYDKFLLTQRPYILTEYENMDREKKENVMPFTKNEKFLDKIGLLNKTKIEKEVYYNISIYLPDEIRKVFSYQVKKIKRADRFMMPNEKNEVFSYLSFNSLFGFSSLRSFFPQNLLEMNGNKNEFILATVIFKDKDHNNLFVDVWVKNLKLDRLVFKSNEPFDLNKDYDYTYSTIKINLIAKQ